MDQITSRLNQSQTNKGSFTKPRFEVEIHDHEQIEIELAYPLFPDRASPFIIELYLFIPRNVGVSHQNYSQESFYRDLTAYLRMDSPALTLLELSNPHYPLSPLHHLHEAISNLEKDTFSISLRPITALVKLYGHSFRESLHSSFQNIKNYVQELSQKPISTRQAEYDILLQQIQSMGEQGKQALDQLRILRRRFLPLSGAKVQSAKEIFEHVHDYITAYFVEKIAILSSFFQEQTWLHDGSGIVASILKQLFSFAQSISKVRRDEGFVNPDPDKPRLSEFYTYRRGLIKKSMQQTFYLETRTLRRDHFRRNAIAMIAAGLASIWTLLIPSRSGRESTDFTNILLFIGVVLAYMLRDRIQELSRIYLGKKLRYFDHDTAILGENLALLGLQGVKGRVQEKMHWLSPEDLSESISYLRTHPRTVAGTDISTEEIIHYHRSLVVGPEEKTKFPPGFSLRDILRLNLANFMTRLDDPIETIRFYDLQKGRFLEADSPKVYHINLILEVKHPTDGQITLSRHRIVLNKTGIVRVEKVETP